MGRAPLAVFVAVLCLAALPVLSFLTEQREVIASTPSAYTGLTVPLPLPAHAEACVDEVVFDTNADIARFGATAAPGETAPALEVVARGNDAGKYRSDYKSSHRVAGGWQGERQLDVPLTPPDRAVFGLLCIKNLEGRAINLVGSSDGRAFSRPSVKINGELTPTELQLRLMESGTHSLLSRLGQMTAHAATLRPLGAWWFWLLALALLTLVPLGVLGAMRVALDGDEAQAASAPAPEPWPSERLRGRVERIPGWAIVLAVGAFTLLWLGYWGMHTHVFQNDEDQYVYLSRWLQNDFPASLFDFTAYGRGLQRLEVWLLAIPSALFDAPRSLEGGRLLNTLAWVSTAIPVYLLGRRLELRPQWAALPAAVSIVVPWAVVTTGFLTENVAYPACLWAIWGIWRTAAVPSARADLLALVLLVVAGAARSGLLLLVPVLPIVVAGTCLRCGAGDLLTRARTNLREHWLLWSGVGFGLGVLVLDGLGAPGADGIALRLAGGYQTELGFDLFGLLAKMGSYFSKVVIGTGFFPAAIGLPWLVIQLARSRDPGRFAFALLAVVSALAMLYSLNVAGPDERYVLYLAPLVLLPATLAIARREISPLGVAIASVLLALLVIRVPWNAEQGPFGFFVVPVEMFYTRAIGLRGATLLPGDAADVLVLAGLALGAAGLALAACLKWAPRRLSGATAIVLVGAVVLIVPIQTQYALSKYVNGAGSRSAPGLRERAFADTNVPKGATVAEFTEGVGQQPGFFGLWQEVQFYNQKIDRVFALGENQNPVPPGDELVSGVGFDKRTGRVTSPKPLPDYFVIPTQVGTARVRGEVVSAPSYVAVALVKLAKPATLAWSARGFGPDGIVPDDGANVRFYGTGLSADREQCASYALIAPPDGQATWRIETSGQVAATGTIEPGARSDVTLPLRRLVERGFIDAHIEGGARVAGINVVDGC